MDEFNIEDLKNFLKLVKRIKKHCENRKCYNCIMSDEVNEDCIFDHVFGCEVDPPECWNEDVWEGDEKIE